MRKARLSQQPWRPYSTDLDQRRCQSIACLVFMFFHTVAGALLGCNCMLKSILEVLTLFLFYMGNVAHSVGW